MTLKRITAVAMIFFAIIVLYFLIAGVLLYNPNKKPSPSAISAEVKAIKDGVFTPSKAIVH